MSDILQVIADHNRELVAQAKEGISLEQMRSLALDAVRAQNEDADLAISRSFFDALAKPGMQFICEAKKASPSKGLIAPDFPYLKIAQEYQEAGAAAISCLTEPRWFMGSIEYLKEIAVCVSIPVLRKDFIIDEYQIYEAKAAGASAVLLICSILDDEQISAFSDLANELGMSTLVEAHDELEIKRALSAQAKIIGVNNRNLRDFSVNFNNAARLRELVPPGVIYVAESGVKTEKDVEDIAKMGADAALIGEALMRSENKPELLASFKQAARQAVTHG